ncbi:ABC transporter substrate-binding protein [Paenibacillus sp. ACRRX]|uniref:ABC transporter substrate-binding protein n=1 Tax=Paenibacillus sp. ACRRX TaxID=2918206 RepID=UPI001EF46917|nr:ABC transporter substrate-binding protein [Paenibacillus sp. ACRRX]MCG7406634.1 ABC transporter substrate-binding protein [Paenibacillus sp. ACRRX]
MKTNFFRIRIVAAFLCLIIVLSACSTNGSKQDKDTLVIGYIGELSNFYPTMTDMHNKPLIQLVYDMLVRYENGEIKPGLATEWKFNESGTELTFKVRQGVKFHDGEALNAAAVIANLDYYQHEGNASFLKAVSTIDKLEAVDEYTVKITYKAPYYPVLHDFATQYLAIVSPKSIIKDNYQSMNGTIGTGPYIHDSFKKGEYTSFKKNKDYWGDKPAYEQIVVKYVPDSATRLKALQTGEVDVIFSSTMITNDEFKQATSMAGVKGKTSTGSHTRALAINASSENLTDLRVREAIAYAVNKQELAEGLTYGNEAPADQMFDGNIPYIKQGLRTKRAFDLQQAAALLDQAGWKLNEGTGYRELNGKPKKLRFTYETGDTFNKQLATALQGQLKKVGLQVDVEGTDVMTWWTDCVEGRYDITIWNAKGSPEDPHHFVGPMLDQTAHTASMSKLPEVADMKKRITEVLHTRDEAKITSGYDFILNYLNDNVIVVPLTNAKELILYRTDKVVDYTFGGLENGFNPVGVHKPAANQ